MGQTDGTDARSGRRPGRLVFEYRLSEDVALTGETWSRHIERWNVTVAGEGGERVGYAQVIILNLDGDVGVSDLTDEASGEWREPVAVLARQLRRLPVDPSAGAGALGDHVLVLDRVFIEPGARGRGLGPIVAALVIGRLRRGCHVAVCFPAPFDGPRREEDRESSIAALGRIW